ncbi:MAG TPA: bifunctional oligoribonuclease/PAP phosphatase NrnA [Cytophagaceae bacterium]|jgi:phosphoesterase RecJ-like protein
MQNFEVLEELLSSPKKIIITTHHKPDADALGSSLALSQYFGKKGHEVQVITPTDYPSFLNWMNGNDGVIIFDAKKEDYFQNLLDSSDLIFCLDFNSLNRINELGILVRNSPTKKVLIDHHLEPENFADFTYSDTTAAATAVLIYHFIVKNGDSDLIDKCIGECLYAGIMTDTGSFRHSSTNREVHLIIADLMMHNVDTSRIHQLIYDNNSEIKLRFLGYALSKKLVILKELHTAYIAISADELKTFESQTGDTEGLVNFALSVDGIVMAAVLIERSDAVKISFRSKGNFNVNQFARQNFEGGGHQNASGGKSDLNLEQTVQKFIALLPNYKEQLLQNLKTEITSC